MAFDINDPKNRPFVIGGAIVILAIGGGLLAMQLGLFSGGGGSGGTVPETPPAVSDSARPAAGTTNPPSGTPGNETSAAAGTKGTTKLAKASATAEPVPLERARKDPMSAMPGAVNAFPSYIPRISILKTTGRSEEKDLLPKVQPAPPRRLAGVVMNGGIWAVFENGTETKVVKPGDVVANNIKIIRIRRNSMTIQVGDNPRLEEVLLKPAPPREAVAAATTGGGGGRGGRGVPGGPPSLEGYGGGGSGAR